MSSESIILYHVSDLTTPITAKRDEVYSQRDEKYSEYYIAVVDAFVFNTQGEMLLQRRAKHKKTSPGLLHTAVAWHIDPGDTAEFTMFHECLEEIGVPCGFAQEGESFFDQVKKLKPFLEKMAFLKLYKHYRKDFVHVDQNYSFLSRDDTHTFFGVFSGSPVCLDDSVEEFVWITLENLDEKILKNKADLTMYFVSHYAGLRSELYAFRDELIG